MDRTADKNNRTARDMQRRGAAQGSAKLTKEMVWNGWTNNYRRAEDGYIIHACIEVRPRHLVAICGSGEIQETGMLNLMDDWQPGCIKCRKKLRKLGLLPPNGALTRDAETGAQLKQRYE